MKGKKRKTYKFGAYTWFGFALPMKEKLKGIKEAGFDSICLWWDDGFSEMDGGLCEQMALAEKNGLLVEHAHIPYFGCDKLWLEGSGGDETADKHVSALKRAAEFDVPVLVMHPFEINRPSCSGGGVFSRRFAVIAEAAEKYQVKLAVENLGDNHALKKILTEYSGNPYIGMCFDSGHNNITAPNDFSLLRDFSSKLFALHLHDNNSLSDSHSLPFEGSINWKNFMKALEETDFDGSLMLEATYPIDYEAADKDPSYEFPVPEISAREYLDKAYRSLEKMYAAYSAADCT